MMLINPEDSLERQNEKLLQIVQSLMRRVEQKSEESGVAYAQFERAALLEGQVRDRTMQLERALDLLQDSNARLARANSSAEAARSNLADAIETVAEGFALFDASESLVLANSRFCKALTDIKPRLVEGLAFADYVQLVANSRDLSLPEGESPKDWAARRMRRHGDAHSVFNVSLNRDRWLQVSEHRTASGGTVILQTDVTSIFRAERREREKLQHGHVQMLQATLDHLTQGVAIFDAQARLAGWNDRLGELFDITLPERTLGSSFAELARQIAETALFIEGRSQETLVEWAAQRGRRQPLTFELQTEANRFLQGFAQEMPDRGFVVSFTDVTSERQASLALQQINELLEHRVEERTLELEEALDEAERANTSKSRFVAAASHDLMQPLSAAKLFLSSLTEAAGPGRPGELADKATQALGNVEDIITALLDISKLDLGRASFDVQSVPLKAIFEPLRHQLEPTARAKGIGLRIIDTNLTVRSDPAFLRRIVQNLVSNAVNYTDTGKVILGVRRNGSAARIEVWDSGRGIAPEDQALVFQEFKRLETRGDGLGLGLAIVERACKGLGHPLSLWSEKGVGSCFSLNVPVAESTTVPSVKAPAAHPDLRDKGPLVLLVENDTALARALTQMIEGWGAHVLHAHNAPEALELLAEVQLKPDAMLLDEQLGHGMTGTELYSLLRGRFGSIPARILSADRSRRLREACAALGLELLGKPVDRDRIGAFLVGV
ncbi:PAS-domain containing protein [Vannielia litorea]|uniref:hybrid sensor histidine kinase/response regulator n=1 Tax=Vannielia litorea TaxID=1217970 RepID=UPI001C965D73|nr:PAS-domain containing protein [Vannielia litorea]MBY6049849.1 PAS-domain containing protein [Vannielia litorea]MBY6077263.1 PAS-domain containing protein [Vannielia litorea]